MYIAKAVGYEPQVKKMAEQIQDAINEEIAKNPQTKFVTFSVTPSAKAILIFEVPGNAE